MNIERIPVVALMAWLLVVPLLAQESVGRITGAVRDASGALVPAARVSATHDGTGVTLTTSANETGIYTFPSVVIGAYSVSVAHDGFKTLDQQDVRVVSGTATVVDFELQVGQTTETLTVVAEAADVDTVSNTVGTTRTTEEIARLPLAMKGGLGGARFSHAFLPTLTGVSFNPQSTGQDLGSGSTVSGAPPDSFGYEIDGLKAGQQGTAGDQSGGPVPEAIEEFRLSTAGSLESGWNNGVMMSLVTKSGTNQFHGSFFNYFRNEVLDARPWFAAERAVNKQNNFGLSSGGPIIRDKAFYFVTYDGYRHRTLPGGVTASVPTQAMRDGNFAELLGPEIGMDTLGRPVRQGQIYDPMTTRADGSGGIVRDPFSGNVIPQSRISSISDALQQGYDLPNRPGAQLNYVGTLRPFPTDQDRLTVKLDHNFSAKHRSSFGYDNIMRLKNRGGTGLFDDTIAFYYLNEVKQPRLRANHTWIMRPDMLLNFRIGLTYREQIIGNPLSANFGEEIGLRGVNDPSTPTVEIQGYQGFGPIFRSLNSYYVNVPAALDLSWSKGSHNLKFGSEFLLSSSRQVIELLTSGQFFFQDPGTALPSVAETGAGYASFLLGEVNNALLMSPQSNRFGQNTWGFYILDEWRATPKLTINYGLRYDLFLPPRETYDRIGHFDPTISNPGADGFPGAITFYGDGPGRNGRKTFADVYHHAFGPRLGLAYAFDPKTVVRASYGISYSPLFRAFGSGGFGPSVGWTADVNIATEDGGVTPAFNWNDGFPPIFPELPNTDPAIVNGSGVPYIRSEDFRPGRAQNLNFGIERELPGRVVVRANYIGNLIHGMATENLVQINQLEMRHLGLGSLLATDIDSPEAAAAGVGRPYSGFSGSVAQALRPFPQYQNINQLAAPAGTSLYHSMQLNVQKRFGHGFSLLAGYTISKQLVVLDAGQQHTAIRAKNLYRDRDRAQMLSLSYVWDLPFGNPSNPVLRQLIGGWQISGIHNYMSGTPVAVSTRASLPGGFGGVWANRVNDVPMTTGTGCGSYDPGGSGRYLNIDAFSTPGPYSVGNTGVLPNVRTCGYLNESFSVQKSFFVRESMRFRVGADFFNIFNRHVWTNLNADINNPEGFGRFGGATDPRSIQLFLRFEY